MKANGFRVINEFGNDITSIVSVIVETAVVKVIDEWDRDITSIVDIVSE